MTRSETVTQYETHPALPPVSGFAYVIIKGWPKVLREFGLERDDEH